MVGKILNNRYEIVEKIGEGGMAEVYKARCKVLNRFVAIKVLKQQYINDETFAEKFKRESQAAASLSHPNIVNVYDVGNVETSNGKIPYIVMEYIKGKTLKQVIMEHGSLDTSDTVFYSLQIAEAIDHAHSNHIIHRDIKPHNIMINDNNRVKVTDFGIARAVTSSTMTIGSDTLGSVHYISPEQARGGYTDEKSDIYSLGIVMYEMTTGKLPFDADTPVAVALKHIQEKITTPSEINSNISSVLETIILKCVTKNQSDRYQKMSDLINDLKNIDVLNAPVASKSNNLEDSPTMIIPKIKDADIIQDDDSREEQYAAQKKNKKKTKPKNQTGKKTIILAILLALVVVSGMFFGFSKLKDLFKDSEVVVPDFTGMDIEDARIKAEDSGLKLVIKDKIQSDEFEEGQIIRQIQEPNSKVKAGYEIEVIVSEGGKLIKVPNLANKTLDEATGTIEDLGLEMGESKYEFSDTVPKGLVIEQRPNAYTYLEKGDKVFLVLSKGEEIKLITMPKVIGENIVKAKEILSSLGLKIGKIKEEYNNTFPKDIVYFQSLEEGSKVKANTSVDLNISKGKEPSSEPDPGEHEPEPVEGNIRFQIKLPTKLDGEDYEDVEITIKRTQDGKEDRVYNSTHIANGENLEVVTKGKKGSKFDILFDGVLQESHLKKQ